MEPFNRTNLYYEVRFILYLDSDALLMVCLPRQVRYRPEPDPYRIKDVEAFIKSMSSNAPVDPINPHNRVAVTGIIYVRAKNNVSPFSITASTCLLIKTTPHNQCDAVAEVLRQTGIRAKAYHRGLSSHELDKTLKSWLDGSIECVVATIGKPFRSDYFRWETDRYC